MRSRTQMDRTPEPLIVFESVADIVARERSCAGERASPPGLLVTWGDAVLDLTHFALEHPGGPDLVREFAGGKDIKEAFESVGHSTSATKLLSTFKIGVLRRANVSRAVAVRPTTQDAPSFFEVIAQSVTRGNALPVGAVLAIVAALIGMALRRFWK